MGICGSKLCQPADQQYTSVRTRTVEHEGVTASQRISQRPPGFMQSGARSERRYVQTPRHIYFSGVNESNRVSSSSWSSSDSSFSVTMRNPSERSMVSELSEPDMGSGDLSGRVSASQ